MDIHTWISSYEYPYMDILIWISIYNYPYMDIHIWISIYGYPYTVIPIRLSIYGYPYMDIQIWISIYRYPYMDFHAWLSIFNCRIEQYQHCAEIPYAADGYLVLAQLETCLHRFLFGASIFAFVQDGFLIICKLIWQNGTPKTVVRSIAT